MSNLADQPAFPIVMYVDNSYKKVHMVETNADGLDPILDQLGTVDGSVGFITEGEYRKKIKYPIRVAIEEEGVVIGYVTCKDPDKNDVIDYIRSNRVSFWVSVVAIVICILILIFY